MGLNGCFDDLKKFIVSENYNYIRSRHENWFDFVGKPESKTKECANFKFEIKSSVK